MTSHGIQIISDDNADPGRRGSSSILKHGTPPQQQRQQEQQQQQQQSTSTSTEGTPAIGATGSSKKLKMRFNLVLALGILLGLIGASLLVAFGLWYVKPYMRVSDMVGTQCTTHFTQVEEKLVVCKCTTDGSTQCLSKYPCLKVWVNLTTESGQVLNNVTIYDSYETFDQFYEVKLQCSYHKCGRNPGQNLAAVEQFENLYGNIGQSFWCYYRPSRPDYALLEVITAWTVVHCMLWPSIALVAGLTILLVHLNMDSAKSKRKTNHFNSLERPWLRHADRNYEKVISET